jgi:hypothetical protein
MVLIVGISAGVALSAITEVTTSGEPDGSLNPDAAALAGRDTQPRPFENLPEWIIPLPYHVAGGTKPEIREAVRQALADLNGEREGPDFGAVTLSQYAYEVAGKPTRTTESAEGTWTCEASGSVTVSLRVTMRYPVWDSITACADSELISGWQSYVAALHSHELGHAYIARSGLRRLELELAGIEASATAVDRAEACELAVRAHRDLVDEAFRRITDEISQVQQEYDARTDYGRSHGASF